MSEEDIWNEKQIISMIKGVLKEEGDEKRQEIIDTKFNLKLLDLNSPVYHRKEKKSTTLPNPKLTQSNEAIKEETEISSNILIPQFNFDSNEINVGNKQNGSNFQFA